MKIPAVALFFTVCVTLIAQPYQTIRGRVTGTSGDRGKCTIDIEVDGVVEVEVTGIDGRMRALSGSAPTWRRLQCNMPMPPNPGEFKFSPQEGRGRQAMVAEPGQNRGVALVRIEDPEGGREGYKFDLEWRGNLSTNGFGDGGFSNGAGNAGGTSIFNGVGGNNNAGNTFPGPNNNVPGWSRQLDFSGQGDGYYRNFRGSDELLADASVAIDPSGRVEVQLSTRRRDRIVLQGRLISVDRDRLVAEMAGGAMEGNMDIRLDNRNRVQEVTMTGTARNRFDLRWQRR